MTTELAKLLNEFPSEKPDKVIFTRKVSGGGRLSLSAQGDCDDITPQGVAAFFRTQTKVHLLLTTDVSGEDAAQRVESFTE